jgi:catechol 2,3-dioxygenase-like lactoylglutathione lyase family enzyme
MSNSLFAVAIDCADAPALARFWAGVLGRQVAEDATSEHVVLLADGDTSGPPIVFNKVPEPKTVKNRLHLDLTSGPEDRDAEIERILALGARRVDIGQGGTESWTVLADPEGNEFCVVRPKKSLIA